MPPLPADFIHIKVCKPNLRKTLDTTKGHDKAQRDNRGIRDVTEKTAQTKIWAVKIYVAVNKEKKFFMSLNVRKTL